MTLAHLVSSNYAMMMFNIGTLLLVGYILGKVAESIHLPNITGYLIGGLILGPIFHLLSDDDISHLRIISDLALGFIAFQVGNEFWLGKLKESGRRIVIITIVQAVATSLVVTLLLLTVTSLSVALILGGIATATAPAPIMMIINKYRTKGELTSTIVPIVGLDDAVGVIIFGVMLSIGVALARTGVVNLNIIDLFKEPIIEIGLSILFGSTIGVISGFASKRISTNEESRSKYLDVIIITVFISLAMAFLYGASPILTPMVAGAFVANIVNKDTYVIEEKTIRFFIPPLMILFFTLSGAKLSFNVLLAVGVVGLIYIAGRTIGKVGGAFIGARVTRADNKVQRFLGIAMLPQEGVAIGLALVAYNSLIDINEAMANNIQNIVLASTLVFALSGSILIKMAFQKTGEIRQKD